MRSSIGTGVSAQSGNDELALLTKRKEDLERELARKIPKYRDITERFSLTPSDLRMNLPANSAYVEFLAYPLFDSAQQKEATHYAAFVIQPDKSIQLRELGNSRMIDSAVVRFRQEIVDGKNPTEAGDELRKIVWAPIQECLATQIESIYLCPDGVFSAVPWAAVPGKQKNSVLLHDYSLAAVPCGQYLCNWLRSDKQPHTTPDSMLAVGDVNYEVHGDIGDRDNHQQIVKPLGLAMRGDDPFSFTPLTGTRDELDYLTTIAGEANVKVLRGTHATTNRVLEQLPSARRAHFATHGFFANARIRSALQGTLAADGGTGFHSTRRNDTPARNPLSLSGLVLAGANVPSPATPDESKPVDDGILTAETIAQLPLENLELAVLSACETGLGDVAGGEGVLGLQRAFHMAGAKNVVASLWKVDDRATAALMQLVYHKLIQEHKPIAQALREAQLTLYEHPELLDQAGELRGRIDFEKTAPIKSKDDGASPERRAHPRLWAAFVLSGPGN